MARKSGRSKAEKKNGQKWVETNYDAKKRARELNDGELPNSVALETSYHPLSSSWSAEALPEILFYLNPPPSQYVGQPVKLLIDNETGEIAKSDDNRDIKDFEILPRFISIEVEGWMVEAWRKIDTRIQYPDIRDRQRDDPAFGGGIGLRKLSTNALQNHCRRDCRKVLNNWVEYGRRDEAHRTEVETIEGLSYDNIKYNTVLNPCATFERRLIKVAFKKRTDDGFWYAEPMKITPANVCETTFDILHFRGAGLPGLSDDNCMTKSMLAAWEMSLLLQERAEKHGKLHWSKLDRQCLPVTWFDRLEENKKTTPNPTYDGGCVVCSWTQSQDTMIASTDNRNQKSFTTTRKHARTISSNSDEPLVKKYKREQGNKFDHDSDCDGKEDQPLHHPPLDPADLSSPPLMTPKHLRRPFRRVLEIDENCDAEMKDEDDDATEGVLSSERHSTWSAGGLPYASNRAAIPGLSESPLARYSSSPYPIDESWSQPVAIYGTGSILSQPHWVNVGVFNEAKNNTLEWPGELHDPSMDAMASENDISEIGCRPVSFTSTTTLVDQSFEHDKMRMMSDAAAPFDAGDDFEEPACGLQQSSSSLQHVLGLIPHLENHPYHVSLHHPGRTTAQGGVLSDVFSSPPRINRRPDMVCQPSSFVSDFGYARRNSFDNYGPRFPPIAYHKQNLATDWDNGDLSFTGYHLPLQNGRQFNEDDFIGLPETPPMVSSSQSQSNSTSFLDLLSSEAAMPEEDHGFLNSHMLRYMDMNETLPEHEEISDEGTVNLSATRVACKTPSLPEN